MTGMLTEYINMLGRYRFTLPEELVPDGFRPLKTPETEDRHVTRGLRPSARASLSFKTMGNTLASVAVKCVVIASLLAAGGATVLPGRYVFSAALDTVPAWEQYDHGLSKNQLMLGVDARSRCDAIAVGLFGRFSILQDCQWHQGFTPERLFLSDVAMTSLSSAWIVGEAGAIHQVEYSELDLQGPWSVRAERVPSPTDLRLGGVDIDRLGSGWIVGAEGVILRLDGDTEWVQVESPTTSDLEAVDLRGDGTGWAVGEGGVTLFLDEGGKWQVVESPVSVRLRAVTTLSDGSAWTVGDEGVIMRFDGERWLLSASPYKASLYAIDVLDDGRGWIGFRPVGGHPCPFLQKVAGSWKLAECDIRDEVRAIHIRPSGFAFAVGASSMLFFYEADAITTVQGIVYLPALRAQYGVP